MLTISIYLTHPAIFPKYILTPSIIPAGNFMGIMNTLSDAKTG